MPFGPPTVRVGVEGKGLKCGLKGGEEELREAHGASELSSAYVRRYVGVLAMQMYEEVESPTTR